MIRYQQPISRADKALGSHFLAGRGGQKCSEMFHSPSALLCPWTSYPCLSPSLNWPQREMGWTEMKSLGDGSEQKLLLQGQHNCFPVSSLWLLLYSAGQMDQLTPELEGSSQCRQVRKGCTPYPDRQADMWSSAQSGRGQAPPRAFRPCTASNSFLLMAFGLV